MDIIVDQIRNNGYYILKNYIDKDICKKISYDIIHNSRSYSQGEGNDKRYSNFLHINAQEFLYDKYILNIGNILLGHKPDRIKKRCQLGVLDSKYKNSSSGGGFHVDNLEPQFKAILYLTDVSINNGPFAIINPPMQIEDIDQSMVYNTYRIINPPECKEFTDKYKDNIDILTGNMGDVILVNTNNIHRGTIIKEGYRLTLTNYYYD